MKHTKFIAIPSIILIVFFTTGFLIYNSNTKDDWTVDNKIQKTQNNSEPKKETVTKTKLEMKADLQPSPEAQPENESRNDTTANQKPPSPFSFVAIGDSESTTKPTGYNDELIPILQKSKEYDPNFAIFTGDIISALGPTPADSMGRIKNLKKLIPRYYPESYITIGSHDIECGMICVKFWNNFYFSKEASQEEIILYHSFDYENTHFVLLSSEYPKKRSVNEAQLDWLDNDLNSTNKPNKIVISHVPPVAFFKKSSNRCHDMSCNEPEKSKLLSVLKRNKVDLVISGHEHAFDHKVVDGIDYVLSGNSGNSKRHKNSTWKNVFTIFDVSGSNISAKAINLKGELIREIKIK